jgi:hypothetical protein
MSDSMTKYNHRMTAEESITNFITFLEESNDTPLSNSRKEWLYKKGYEIFDTYYVDEVAQVNLATQDDKEQLLDYFASVQETLGKMFAHIMLLEFKLHLLTG